MSTIASGPHAGGHITHYTKPWKSYDDQLDQPIARGMVVTDRPLAIKYLKRIGYYRLSGYWYACRQRSTSRSAPPRRGNRNPPKYQSLALDEFKSGSRFEAAVNLYVFDKQLRLLTLDALERIEVAMRVDVQHAQLITRSKEDFVRHNRTKYGLPLAIWVACEVWDFGALSTLFSGMREAEQDAIASKYGVG